MNHDPSAMNTRYNPSDITILPNLDLYHVTPKNIPKNYDEWPFLADLPSTTVYTYDLNRAMYFGLTEMFTNYYIRSVQKHQKLMFTTTKSLRLIHFTGKAPLMGNGIDGDTTFYDFLIARGYDGLLMKGDPNDGFLEICIFKPTECITLVKEINTKFSTIRIPEYPSIIDDILVDTYITSRKIDGSLVVEIDEYTAYLNLS